MDMKVIEPNTMLFYSHTHAALAEMSLNPALAINNVSLCSQTPSVNVRGPSSLSPGLQSLPNRIPPAAAISYICCIDVVTLDCSVECI